jgi:hypothetical protein
VDTSTGQAEPEDAELLPPGRISRLREARAAGVTIALLAVAGLAMGLLWSVVSPRVHVIVTTTGPDLEHYGSDEFFAGDASFALIGAAVGLLAAVAVWWLARRWRGPVQLLVLAVGCLACGLVAWQVGRHIGLGYFHDLLRDGRVGQRFVKPVDLRAKVVLVAAPLTAVIGYVVLASWVARPDLGVPRWSVETHGHLQLREADRHRAQPPEHGHLPLEQPELGA